MLVAPSANAADWGSFDGSRMAYMAGALTGSAHSQLRSAIETEGDTILDGTPTLTTEYLDTVDVFYTAMLYAGTGGASGDTLGSLSNEEAAALDAWVSAGGTLIMTVDSTGLKGDDFATIYDTWGTPYGIGDFVFDPTGPSTAAPLVEHPITTDVTTYEWINRTVFSVGDDAMLLGYGTANQPFLAVLEPASGFAEGGRILVIGDHNILANSGIASSDNTQLAENIAAWANGECGNTLVESGEECDDGNDVDDDACTNTCLEGGGETTDGTSTGGRDSSTESGATDGTSSGDDDSSTGRSSSSGSTGSGSRGSTGSAGGETTGAAETGSSETGAATDGPVTTGTPGSTDPQPTSAGSTGDGDTDAEGSGQADGGGCRVAGGRTGGWLWLLGLGAFAPRRRRG